jgi:amino acid adenylation domain-containing protein
MTSVVEFLSYLQSLDVEVWADGERLRYRAPKGALTDELRVALTERKAGILSFLSQADRSAHSVAPIPHVDRSGSLTLSFAQQRLWFLDRLDPGSPTYNVCAAIHFDGALEVAALEQSINEIVRRHEALRTTFAMVGPQPVQVIAPSLALPLTVVDLEATPAAERDAHAQRLATEEARRPFDLARGPLLRATLLRLEQERHILALTMHHIVSDGWSMGVLFREMAALYNAFANRQPSPLSELRVQYADFAVWQRAWLLGDGRGKSPLQAQLAYWRNQLSGSPAILQLPTDRPRPAIQTFNGARETLRLPATLAQTLKDLSRREGVTLFMTLLAGFKTLLYRYTNQTDVLVGSPIANRNREEIEPLIGFFANTQVLRTDLAGNPRFRELLQRVREVTVGAYAHQDVPFEKLMEELHPERALSYTPFFQVMFILQNAPMPDVALSGLNLSPQEIITNTAKFDLVMNLGEQDGALAGWIEYNTDLFDAASIARFARHYQTLLEGVVADPDCRLLDLPLLAAAEQQQLLHEWSAGRTTQPPDACIHTLFDEQAARTPNEVAFVYDGAQITYSELACRANQLAHYLQASGVGPETLVAVCLERSLELAVGALGVLKAGAAYVPLDPTYPQERIAFMLEDSRAPILLTQQRLLSRLPTQGLKAVCLDTDWEAITRESAEDAPRSGATPDSPAYVIYTSGSTGRPKGVLGLHRGAINRFHWMWNTYPFAADEVCCQKTSLSFVDSIWELFGPLLQGVRTVIIPDAQIKDPQRLVETLAGSGVTRIVLAPSLLRVLVELFPDLQQRLPRLRYWVTSGEALPLELYQRFRVCFPQATLLNLYGSSEVSADATWYETSDDTTFAGVPIGRPIDNTQVYLLDARLQPVPVGVPGELYVGGRNLARGYVNRPDLTAERFVPNPFATRGRGSGVGGQGAGGRGRGAGVGGQRSGVGGQEGYPNGQPASEQSRLYRTGDLARYLPDGNIEYLGRADHQLKIRGFRIELGEIETVLSRHPDVRQAVVLARTDMPGDRRLVAYVVPTAGQPGEPAERLSISELQDFLRTQLPEYMLPRYLLKEAG